MLTGIGNPTGKVDLEGSMSANDMTPPVGAGLYVYLNATPLHRVAGLKLGIKLPQGIEPAKGFEVERIYAQVEEDETVTFSLPVYVREGGPKTLVGFANVSQGADLVLSRSFVIVLNGPETPEVGAQSGTNKDGEPLVIYEGGRSSDPK